MSYQTAMSLPYVQILDPLGDEGKLTLMYPSVVPNVKGYYPNKVKISLNTC